MIKCILGQKIGDSLLEETNGELHFIYPDTFYPKNVEGYWMLKYIENRWEIVKVLFTRNSVKEC